MKNIIDCLDLDFKTTTNNQNSSTRLNPESIKIVDYIFTKFRLICRGFDNYYYTKQRLDAEKTLWYSAFSRKRIEKLSQIKNAEIKLEHFKFPNPPQLGEFLEWCNPSFEDLGLFPKEKAIKCAYSILRGSEPANLSETQSLILKHSIQETGSFFMKNNIASTVEPVFYRNYEIAIRDFIAGNLKPIPKAIEDKVEKNNIDPLFAEFNCRERSMSKLRDILR